MGPLDPIRHLDGFVIRREVREDGSVCEPPEWAADDVLTVEEALPLMTMVGGNVEHCAQRHEALCP
jgi:hypothetical protein